MAAVAPFDTHSDLSEGERPGERIAELNAYLTVTQAHLTARRITSSASSRSTGASTSTGSTAIAAGPSGMPATGWTGIMPCWRRSSMSTLRGSKARLALECAGRQRVGIVDNQCETSRAIGDTRPGQL